MGTKWSSLIAQSGEHLEHVNRIVITIPEDGGEAKIKGELIELWADQVKDAPQISQLVTEITKEVSAKMDEKIGGSRAVNRTVVEKDAEDASFSMDLFQAFVMR